MSRRQTVRTLLSDHPLFGRIEDSGRDALFSGTELVSLAAGDVLYRADEPATRVFVLLEGALQIEYPKAKQTRGFVAAMLPAPGFLGECQTLHSRPWSGTGVAMFPLTALALSRETLERLLLEHPRFALAMYQELALRFLGAINAWKHQQKAAPLELLARYLLSHVAIRTALKRRPFHDVEVSQAELGTATGLRRETVNRLLRRLERRGLLELGSSSVRNVRTDDLSAELPEQRQRLLVQELFRPPA